MFFFATFLFENTFFESPLRFASPQHEVAFTAQIKFGVMQPTIANAQDVSSDRHDHSDGGNSEGHLIGDKLVTRGCLQNSCIATNSHFDNPEYQMSPPDSDDDSIFDGLVS